MKIFVKDIKGLVLPKQANDDTAHPDAGYDVVATTEGQIVGEFIERPLDHAKVYRKIAYIEYGTNLYISPQDSKQIKDADFIEGCDVFRPPTEVVTKYHTLLHPRSSISKQNLVLANSVGIIDNGYRNQIMVRFKYIFQPEDLVIVPEANVSRIYGLVNQDLIYKQGERICQIKASPNIPIEFEVVKDLNATERGLGGFGSTGT